MSKARNTDSYARHLLRSAFTLVEMMVVILIIAILAGVLFVAVRSAFSGADNSKAETLVKSVATALENFTSQNQFTPAGTVLGLGQQCNKPGMDPNDTNQGIEALVLALRGRLFGGPHIDKQVFDSNRGNTDNPEDSETINVNFADVEGLPKLWELVDPWGNPLFYANVAIDLPATAAGTRQIMLKDGTITEVDLATLRQKLTDPATGELVTKTFVLYSFGKDGINDYGRNDDVVSWPTKLEDE